MGKGEDDALKIFDISSEEAIKDEDKEFDEYMNQNENEELEIYQV